MINEQKQKKGRKFAIPAKKTKCFRRSSEILCNIIDKNTNKSSNPYNIAVTHSSEIFYYIIIILITLQYP